jgi:uncharacterized protein
MIRRLAVASSLIVLFAAGGIRVIGARDRDQQTPPAVAPTPTPSPTPKVDEEDGTPITSAAVKTACGDCHSEDAKHRFTRISYRRTTPEGWQETIRRMVSLNKASIEPDQAREVVKYLSDHLGLAPEELKPAAFEVERRLIDFKYTADAETERVCSSCHSIGRVMLQRRSAQEWNLLINMHRGWYPLVDFQVFRRGGPPDPEPGADGRPPDNRHPYEKAVAHLKSAFPLTTQEWTAWSATMRSPQLAGTWALKGYENGSGPFYGQMTITAGASADEFTTATSFTYPRSGKTVTRAGRAVIYTGFQWRGRSTVGGSTDIAMSAKVMMVDRDWRTLSGRWFTGGYDEMGVDIQLTHVSREPSCSVSIGRRSRSRARRRASGCRREPSANLSARDIDFGRGVSVTRVVSSTPTLVTMDVTVAADAPPGAHDLVVSGVVSRAAVAIYSQVDFIKIAPGWNMARVGGVVFPKMMAQFEAIAYSNGPDGKPDTNDDIALGPVDATWTTEEYMTIYDDDDGKFVGDRRPQRRSSPRRSTGRIPRVRQPQQRRRRVGRRGRAGAAGRGKSDADAGARAPGRDRAALHAVGLLHGGWQMIALQPGDCHAFEAAGRRFLYLAPSAAVMAIDDVSAAVFDTIAARPQSRDDLVTALAGRHAPGDIDDSVAELVRVRALTRAELPHRPAPKILPLTPIPLATMVMNVTNQCNLSCALLRYGEDKIVQTDNGRQPKWMSEETARESVELLLRESGTVAHLTFFGGETLMNFKVLKTTWTTREARRRAGQDDRLLAHDERDAPQARDHRVPRGQRLRRDGLDRRPKDLQNKFRVFHGGAGSYEIVAPKIKALIARHRSRPIGARVTLTRDTLDVRRIYEHLTNELGFWEVGFAPVTAAPGRPHAFGEDGFSDVLAQFRDLAADYRDAALASRHHGFGNVHETLGEIHKGASKAWPCGAGFGLLGVSTAGDVALCHRFAGSDDHKLGDVHSGIDRAKQAAFLDRHHVANKTDCATCWARPVCAGGCYHEAHTRYGTTERPNLHYCEWIRGWTDTCLKIYGEIAEANPGFSGNSRRL